MVVTATLGGSNKLEALIAAVEANDRALTARELRELPDDIIAALPPKWLAATIEALASGTFDALSAGFISGQFVGPGGRFLIVAPYAIRRATGDISMLSALYGEIIDHEPTVGLVAEVETIQNAQLRQRMAPLRPMRVFAGAGNLRDLAFVVPDGWGWVESALGSALTEIGTQRDRFEAAGKRCVRQVFDADTADLLLTPLTSKRDGAAVHLRSYEIHDAGHAAGLGLARKVRDNVLPGYWYRGVEEWRADGIGFEAAARLLTPVDAASDLASNLCVRFGLDVPLAEHGIDGSNEHVPCSLIILDRLLREGFLAIRHGKLALKNVSARGLSEAFEPHRYEAVDLTRRELVLGESAGIMRLYGSVGIHRATEAILEGMIRDPCRGFYDGVLSS